MQTFIINDKQQVELTFDGEDRRLAELNAGNGATVEDVALGAVVVQAMRLMNKKPFWELVGRIIESTMYLDDNKVAVFGKEYCITRDEVAQILGVSLSQVERFRRAGKLPYIKLGHKCVRYRRSDCEKLLRACTIGKGIEG